MEIHAQKVTSKFAGFRGQPALIAALLALVSCGAAPARATMPPSRYKGYEFDFDRKAAGPVEVTLKGLSLHTVTTQLKARPRANVYDTEAVLGPLCPTLASHYAGRVAQSWANNNIYVMLTSEGFEKGVFLHLFSRTR